MGVPVQQSWIAALGLLLAACGLEDEIQFEIREMAQRDHWAGDGAKTCQPYLKILNNTEGDIENLFLDLVWTVEDQDPFVSTFAVVDVIASDTASITLPMRTIYAPCDDVKLARFENIRECVLTGFTKDECITRLTVLDRR